MIQVYGGGDSVELFLNGKSLGMQPCGRETDFETQYHTVYEPGELTAVAYEDGAEIGRTSLKTAGKAARLALHTEKYETLAFVDIDVLDKDGILAAGSRASLSIQVTGPAELLAFGGVGALHKKGYELPETTAGEGHALAILKIEKEGEQISVTVDGEGIEGAHAVL